jgi:hypothetical protein
MGSTLKDCWNADFTAAPDALGSTIASIPFFVSDTPIQPHGDPKISAVRASTL